ASRTDLRKFNFDAPAAALRALEQVADVLRLATDEDVLFHSMLNVALNAMPRADAAAIVHVPEESTDEHPRSVVRTQVERMAGSVGPAAGDPRRQAAGPRTHRMPEDRRTHREPDRIDAEEPRAGTATHALSAIPAPAALERSGPRETGRHPGPAAGGSDGAL